MVRFVNGPAKGKALALQRAPLLLRVVIDGVGNIDALDQTDDTPTQHEKVTVYERVGEAGQYIMCRRGYGCQQRAEAEYRQCDTQPSDEVARDNRRWQQWCIERCAEGGRDG